MYDGCRTQRYEPLSITFCPVSTSTVIRNDLPSTTIADADASGIWSGKVVTKISEAGPFWEAGPEDQNYLEHYPDGKNQFNP